MLENTCSAGLINIRASKVGKNLSKQERVTEYPTSYREEKIGRTTYCVTSIFTGEKELGPTLEKLATQRVLDEMSGKRIK